MRTLGALEARFADDHIPLALLLGAIGALTAVRRLLPDESVARAAPPTTEPGAGEDTSPTREGFIVLLLGAIVTHDRLLALFGPTLAVHAAGDAEAEAGGEVPDRLEGLLR